MTTEQPQPTTEAAGGASDVERVVRRGEPIDVWDIKKGQFFYERGSKFEALEDARRVEEGNKQGWGLLARRLSGSGGFIEVGGEIDFFEAYKCHGYKLCLYSA